MFFVFTSLSYINEVEVDGGGFVKVIKMKSETGEDYRTELLHQARPEAKSWRLNLREFRLPERRSADPPFSLKGLLHHMTPSMYDFAVNLLLFYVVSLMRWS